MELSRYLHVGAPQPLRVAVGTADGFVTRETTTYAAALRYQSLLALFPFAIFLIAVVNSLASGACSTCCSIGRERLGRAGAKCD